MPAFPPGPEGTGIVLVTLSTGLTLEAEWSGTEWWAHLNDNPDAAPLDPTYVVSWQPLE